MVKCSWQVRCLAVVILAFGQTCHESSVSLIYAALAARDTKEATFLFVTQPALADHTLSHMTGVVVKARDGLELPCYLSLPVLPEGQVPQISFGVGYVLGYGFSVVRQGQRMRNSVLAGQGSYMSLKLLRHLCVTVQP